MNAIEYLDALGAELAEIGWSSAILFDRRLLRVWHGSAPKVGDSIGVAAGPAGEPWYCSSLDALVWPCAEPRRAARELVAWLGPYVGPMDTFKAETAKPERLRRLLRRFARNT